MRRILVVGAGFAGAVVARELADAGGHAIDVIDRRDHIAGNAFDPVDAESGLRIHRYGPHIFHTNDEGVFAFLSRFTSWIPYNHCVEAYVEGVGHVPLPINRTTLNRLYRLDLRTEEDVRAYLETIRERHESPRNAREAVENVYGKELTELFFARYSEKMWQLTLDQLPASVVARLPVRYDDQRSYFSDKIQAMPEHGYETLFRNLLDHPAITVRLGVEFDPAMESGYDHVFNSMPIDVYFGLAHGPLPYRSIRFRHEKVPNHRQPTPTVNFTDTGPVTRQTDWRLYPGCGTRDDYAIVTSELPCSYEENGFERYYPVKTVDGGPQEIYRKYQAMAKELPHVTFIGRCGQYQYFDMHQVVANSRMIAKRFLDAQAATAGDPAQAGSNVAAGPAHAAPGPSAPHPRAPQPGS